MNDVQMQLQSIDLLSLVSTPLKRTANYKGGQFSGPCPMCGGDDRFNVYPAEGRWFCRSCHPLWGDAIDLIRARDGVDFKTACTTLGINLDGSAQRQPTAAPTAPPAPKPSVQMSTIEGWYPAYEDEYQIAALRFIAECATNLQQSNRGRAYLRQRGITDTIQRLYHLGYNMRNQYQQWGSQQVYLPRGIVIPWMADGFVDRVNIRVHDDERTNRPELPKYIPAAGGISHQMFKRQHMVKPNRKIVMVETELDALMLVSLGRDHRMTPVALGSVTNGLTLANVTWLKAAEHVYIATDADFAGYQCFLKWQYALGENKVTRLKPDNGLDDTAKDPGDVFGRFGYRGLRQWLQPALNPTHKEQSHDQNHHVDSPCRYA